MFFNWVKKRNCHVTYLKCATMKCAIILSLCIFNINKVMGWDSMTIDCAHTCINAGCCTVNICWLHCGVELSTLRTCGCQFLPESESVGWQE